MGLLFHLFGLLSILGGILEAFRHGGAYGVAALAGSAVGATLFFSLGEAVSLAVDAYEVLRRIEDNGR